MNDQLLNERDVQFQLFEMLQSEALCERPMFSEHNIETFRSVLETARKIAEEKFAPHNAELDANEPSFDGKKVKIIGQVKEAYEAISEAGFIAGRERFEIGGMQLPEVIMSMCMGYFTSANPSTSGYPFLTIAAANLIKAFASEELKKRFLPNMLNGRFSGTMALTEPHAGSSLADITTKARVTEQPGVYKIKGSKMYISGGDHEITENIVHLVLAKIEGAPLGVKGISLFLVPKFHVDENDQCAERNDVALAGLIHKLGYRGTTSTVLSFGEKDECRGYLIGEAHQGLKYMFQMMNEARLGVAMGATMIGYRGYLYSLAYARERTQGRLSSQAADQAPVPIINHADVRRMLLAQKAYVEGALSLCLYGAHLIDESNTNDDLEKVKESKILLDLLTPIIKSWCSEYGPKANDLAIQVLGGAGYTREYPVEQYWRDNRLNPIHEGANGIQALDLLGRKVWQNQGSGLEILSQRILHDIELAKPFGDRLERFATAIQSVILLVQKATLSVASQLQKDSPEKALSNASAYLSMLGKVVVSWLWLRQAMTAQNAMSKSLHDDEQSFYQGKLQAAQFFIQHELPHAKEEARLIIEHDDTCYEMQSDWF